jgi:hypothetical protein
MENKIVLGPRQQFLGTNGLRQKLVSKDKAWKEIERLQRARPATGKEEK